MIASHSKNSLNCIESLQIGGKAYNYFSLEAAQAGLGDLSHLPCCIRVLLENLLHYEDEKFITLEDMRSVCAFHVLRKNTTTSPFMPARLLLSDQGAVSLLTDMAGMREAFGELKGNPEKVECACPVDVVVETPFPATKGNSDRFSLIKWGTKTFSGFNAVPPLQGSTNQLNFDVLSPVIKVVRPDEKSAPFLHPDSVLGTDLTIASIGALGVLGWNIDSLEAQNILFGNGHMLTLPHVIGVKVTGKPRKGASMTDTALAIAYQLQQANCAGKFVEFFGPGLDHLTIQDRSLISCFVLSSGALSALFPIDETTLGHLRTTGHGDEQIEIVQAYAKAQGLWHEAQAHNREPAFTSTMEFGLDTVRPVLRANNASQPIALTDGKAAFEKQYPKEHSATTDPLATVRHGDIIWVDIGSYTSTLHVMETVLAGLIVRKAAAQGLRLKPWVCGVLDCKSALFESFFRQTGLLADFEAVGFTIKKLNATRDDVFMPLQSKIAKTIETSKISVCSVSTGPHPPSEPLNDLCHINYIASPAVAVGYGLCGSFLIDLTSQAVTMNKDGKPVLFKELWPSAAEISAIFEGHPLAPLFLPFLEKLKTGPAEWEQAQVTEAPLFAWNPKSAFVRKPPFFTRITRGPARPRDIVETRPLACYGDNVPASALLPEGKVDINSPAGHYLALCSLEVEDFQPYKMFTGNFEVFLRGLLQSPKLYNTIAPNDGHFTPALAWHAPTQSMANVYTVAERYRNENTPMVIFAGKRFGHGPNQEWAVKGLKLIGIRVVVAEGFDPSFRLNLIRMGILPLQLKNGVPLANLKLKGTEFFHFAGIADLDQPPGEVMMTIEYPDNVERYMVHCRLDSVEEIALFRHGSFWAATLRALNQLT